MQWDPRSTNRQRKHRAWA